MIFDELPFEVKEHIFPYVSPNDWINTAKVSKEWLELTLGSIKKVQSCHFLILDHLAEFINHQRNTTYTWASLLAMMPKLEHLECFESTEAFWKEISPVCDQLKVLHCQPINTVPFDWNQLDVSFKNLMELLWDGDFRRVGFPLKFFQLAPKLEKITLNYVVVTPDWQQIIPKNVKHILLHKLDFRGELQFSTNFLCEDPSTVETFSVVFSPLSEDAASLQEFYMPSSLKSLEFTIYNSPPSTSVILCNAFKKCPRLETVKAYGVTITDSWRRAIPENVKSIYFQDMEVKEDMRSDFSYDWFFQNYGYLQKLHVEQESWTQFHSEKFCSSVNLRELALSNTGPYKLAKNAPIDPFSDICAHMIRGSHLVDVTLNHAVIYESWRHIFPPTVKKIRLEPFSLSKEAREVFSPQFICENPSNIELFSMQYRVRGYDPLPAMDLNAFSGMNKLQELHLMCPPVTGECLESILANCFALTDLVVREFHYDAITNISSNLALPSLRNLRVRETVDEPSKLLQHFPKLRTVNIPIVASEECCGLREVETAKIKLMDPSWDLLRSVVKNIDQAKFKYFCLSHGDEGFSFYLTNSLMDACRKLYRFTFHEDGEVLWINNYPDSPLLRRNVSESLPTNMNELKQRFDDLNNNEPPYHSCDDYDDFGSSADDDDDEIDDFWNSTFYIKNFS